MSEQNVKAERAAVRHADITRDLLAGIASGRFPVGSVLPTEVDLCAQYGTSRHTVRVAINELVELGLVSRRKRAGTRIEARTPPGGYRQPLTSLDDLVQFGAAHTRVVQSTGPHVMTNTLAAALGTAPGSRWLRISSLRLSRVAHAAPVGWTDVFIDPAYQDIPALARASPDRLVASLLEGHYGCQIAEIQQDINAMPLPAKVAVPLRADVGTSALRIVRRYLDAAGATLEISDTLHPAGRFTASSRLKRHRG